MQPEERDCGGTSSGGVENSPAMATAVEGSASAISTEQTEAPDMLSAFPWIQSDDSDHSPPAISGARDFIAENQISLPDAQRLFDLYMGRLDYFIYNIGGRYKTIEALRSHSPILTASILTVAAIHDPQSTDIYQICNRELRRLIAESLFDRRVTIDYLRALCVTTNWLSDVGWTLLGIAIRRAAEINLSGNYQRLLTEASEDAADCVRVWYHLYTCDKHLSILYGRQSLAREDLCVLGWEDFLRSSVSTHQDKVLTMQLALQLILTRVNELFGPDNGVPIPVVYSTQIAYYGHQLDNWLGVWSTALRGENRLR